VKGIKDQKGVVEYVMKDERSESEKMKGRGANLNK
jgi:hypothetical protein